MCKEKKKKDLFSETGQKSPLIISTLPNLIGLSFLALCIVFTCLKEQCTLTTDFISSLIFDLKPFFQLIHTLVTVHTAAKTNLKSCVVTFM